ncbi:iron-containing alcohol dehydrogenase [Roseisalinus antarcticus]|uniref:iron-containing alcohol dehydrogenase n=1 Tax=Roseisalinus antarcticus TaxID=254357 RepID=UPI0013563243|nr:iron-containing alcohol dehydrogenase [Roseisalinus antarcticus]
MTLISLTSRIHFAADLLEEALRAEIESNGLQHLVLVCDADLAEAECAQRVRAGIPRQVAVALVAAGDTDSKYDVLDAALERADPSACDAVVAFGSSRAIAFGRKCRQGLAAARHANLTQAERLKTTERDLLPSLMVVPGPDGLPNPCRASISRGMPGGIGKAQPPTVIICDPTLLAAAEAPQLASAFADALGRCLEVLLHDSFNPVADGLALEGIRRALQARTPQERTPAARRRDLMAASLNAALAQSKGPGIIQAFVDAINDVTGAWADGGAVRRILVPPLMSVRGAVPGAVAGLLAELFGTARQDAIGPGLATLMDGLPLPPDFAALGIPAGKLDEAVAHLCAAPDVDLPAPNRLTEIFGPRLAGVPS